MSTVPKGRADRLTFYERHINGWMSNADAMGVPADLVANLKSFTDRGAAGVQPAASGAAIRPCRDGAV